MLINLEQYHRPKSIAEALDLLKERDGSVVPIAGGTHLVSSNDKRIREVVDITHLKLSFIKSENDGLRIGATTTLQEIIDSKKLSKPPYNILREACRATSVSKMIRNVATLGGEIAHGSKYSDITTTLLALDVQVVLDYDKDQRFRVPLWELIADDPKHGFRNRLIVEIKLPAQVERVGAAFIRLNQIQSSPTIISAATLLTIKDGLCQKARIALGAAGPQPLRINSVESMLEGRTLDEAVIEEVSEKVPNHMHFFSDARASAEYRKTVSSVLVKRALRASLERLSRRS